MNSRTLPPELLILVFDKLDRADQLSCLYTCRKWKSLCQRDIYVSPCLSSQNAMASLVRVLELDTNASLRGAVRELHIRGNHDYACKDVPGWVLGMPAQLVHLVPNVRTLKFENIHSLVFHKDDTRFWTRFKGFQQVTELELKNCEFLRAQEIHEMAHYLPSLTALTLSHVRWARRPTWSMEKWEAKPLSLRMLRLDYLVGEKEYEDAFSWLGNSTTLRELQLLHVSLQGLVVVEKFLAHLANCKVSLQTLTISPMITERYHYDLIPRFLSVIQTQYALSAVHLYIINVDVMDWVSRLFDAMQALPIAQIAVDFTLDTANETATGQAWVAMNERLSRYWLKTLRNVTLTHNPTGNFIRHQDVPRTLRSRFPDLAARGILDARIGVGYLVD
ncbi:hypothetical protein C8Q80DRAFT_1125284 [Daedaleopsis nitida]|nr:hypothetical protein C8Q80DRAFT_1125284 [Daedaleopsis nitida]